MAQMLAPSPPGTLSGPSPKRIARILNREDPDAQHRVQRLVLDRQEFWVKRPERLTGRLRIQKGNALRGFERERAALRFLAASELPVPPIVAEGQDFLVLPDRGPSLRSLLRRRSGSAEERVAACAAAGAAVAAFHRQGLAHGRPMARDVCWADGRVTLIDYERFDAARNSLARMRNDLVMLVYSVVLEVGPEAPETAALCAAYRADAPPAVWPAAVRHARRLLWLAPLIRLARRFDGRHGEVAAVLPTLRLFAAAPPPPPALAAT